MPPSKPSKSLNFQPVHQSKQEMTVAFFVYLLRGRAPHVSLCCCDKRSKHWRRDGNTVITEKMRLFIKTARALQARALLDLSSVFSFLFM